MFVQLLLITLSLINSYSKELHPFIFGGLNADIRQYPYQVSIRNIHSPYCGGSIISRKWVLTAGHCVCDGRPPKNVSVVVGTSLLQTGGTRYNVSQIVCHKRYKVYGKNDIAVIKIKEVIRYTDTVQPIRLQSKFIGAGVKATVTGWGLKSLKKPRILSNQLQQLRLSTITMTECRRRSIFLKVFNENICTLSPSGHGMCKGDSGGPLTVDGVLIGIVSRGVICAHGMPDLFISVAVYRSWIKNHTNV